MNFEEYRSCDGIALGELVRAGDVSATELTELAISAAGKYNPVLNAISFFAFDEALEQAARIDQQKPVGPFLGVPTFIKDLAVDRKGWPHTMGSKFFEELVSQHDDTLVTRMEKAGLTFLGKTPTPEFGLLYVTGSDVHGDTRNPWDLTRTAGGSSGGAAALVASGVTPVAHGTDGAGSIRAPAAYCGLVGHKPSRGLVPTGPVRGRLLGGFATDGFLSRSVRDNAAMLDAVRAPESGPPYMAPHFEGSLLDAVSKSPKKLKIALWLDSWRDDTETDHETRKAVAATARLLEGMGHHVEEAAPPLDYEALLDAILVNWSTFASSLSERVGGFPDGSVEPLTMKLVEKGRSVSGSDLMMAYETVDQAARAMGKFHETYDVLLSPVLDRLPGKIGAFDRHSAGVSDWLKMPLLTVITGMLNATGQPSMSVPMNLSESGLPVGVMLTGAMGADPLLFQLAGAIERANPWADWSPPLWKE